MPTLEIIPVPVLSDNYAWLVHDALTSDTAVVDPGEAGPVLEEAERRGWTVSQVWITHWHPDHTGGIADMKKAGATVTGPAAEVDRIQQLDTTVQGGGVVRLGHHTGTVLDTPGHTRGHVAFYFADDALVFTGDTMFAMGCGRIFEGTPAQMHASVRALAALPEATRIYAGHEYTQANGRFAQTVEPDNAALAERMKAVDAARLTGEPTLPTTVAQERATNPFVRAADVEAFAELRRRKDAA